MLLPAVAFVAAGCGSGVDRSTHPELVLLTNPFEVGEEYTLGAVTIEGPATLLEIDVVEARGIEVIGTGAYDLTAAREGIGLVPDWPPSGAVTDVVLELPFESTGHIQALVGVRTTDGVSGLRGLRLRWRNSEGQEETRIFDYAVVTCAADLCEDAKGDPEEWILTELDLYSR